jgi:putative heme degradation protein
MAVLHALSGSGLILTLGERCGGSRHWRTGPVECVVSAGPWLCVIGPFGLLTWHREALQSVSVIATPTVRGLDTALEARDRHGRSRASIGCDSETGRAQPPLWRQTLAQCSDDTDWLCGPPACAAC